MLMNGVNILNSYTVTFGSTNTEWGILICLVGCLLFAGMGFYAYEKRDDIAKCALGIVFSAVGFAMLVVFVINVEEPTTNPPKYTYEVTIDKGVDFKEFTDKYNILNQRGEIYTIEER